MGCLATLAPAPRLVQVVLAQLEQPGHQVAVAVEDVQRNLCENGRAA